MTAPIVRVLGPVLVDNATGTPPCQRATAGHSSSSHTARVTAVIAYLTLHPEGATQERLAAALSPDRRLAPATVHSLVSRARRWLGEGPDGAYLPRTTGAYRVSPRVGTDWRRWLELTQPEPARVTTHHLVEALRLVRGAPFAGGSAHHFSWAEPLRHRMTAGILDVAHELTVRAVRDQQPHLALWASGVARAIDPANQRAFADSVRAGQLAVVLLPSDEPAPQSGPASWPMPQTGVVLELRRASAPVSAGA